MRLKLIIILAVSTVLGGCSLLNPFASKFKCPNQIDGKCQPISESYKNALSTSDDNVVTASANSKNNKPSDVKNAKAKGNDSLEERNIPGRPVRDPGEEIRIKVFKYVDKDILYGKRSIYVEARKPQWVLDNKEK